MSFYIFNVKVFCLHLGPHNRFERYGHVAQLGSSTIKMNLSRSAKTTIRNMIANHYLWIFRLTNYSMSRKKLRKEGRGEGGRKKGEEGRKREKVMLLFQVHIYNRCCCCFIAKSGPALFVTPWSVAHQALLSMGFPQPRILEWVAISFSRGSSQPRDQITSPALADGFFTAEPPGNPRPPKCVLITVPLLAK